MKKILNPFRAIAFVSALALSLAATPAFAAQYVNVNGVAGPTGMIASCTASVRAVADICPGDPWQIGSGGNLDCWTLATPPSCSGVNGTNNVFMCDGLGQDLPSHCTCAPNMIKCGTNCQLTAPGGACPIAGQTRDACTGVCSGSIPVTLQTSPATRQGAAAPAMSVSFFGDLDMTGNLVVGGASTNAGLVTFNGGLTLPSGAGLGKILTSDAAGIATWQAPAAGGVGGSGTVNTLPKFTAGSTLGNSLVTDNGALVTVAGNFATNGTTTFGDAAADTVTSKASGWTFPSITSFALPASVNALNFGTNGLSIDNLNDRVGINVTAPTASLEVGPAATANAIIGNTKLGGNATYGLFQHKSAPDYALLQNAAGSTYLNAVAGQPINFRIGDVDAMTLNSAGNLVVVNGINGPSSEVAFHNGRVNDTSYEFLAFDSGATRQGIILYDGAWSGCSSVTTELCLKAEAGNDLTLSAAHYVNLQADGGWVVVKDSLWAQSPSYFDGQVIVETPTINMMDFTTATSANMGIAFRGRSALTADDTDGWLRLNNQSQFTNGVYTPGNFTLSGNLNIGLNGAIGYISPGSWNEGFITIDAIQTSGNLHVNGSLRAENGVNGVDLWSYWSGANSTENGIGWRNSAAAGEFKIFNRALSVYQPVWHGGSFNKSSIRYKEDVSTLSNALETLSELRAVEFTWKDDAPMPKRGERDIGVIAEEVAKVYPSAVGFGPDGKVDGVDYAMFTPLLIQAMNEQQTVIKNLEARIKVLEANQK